VSIKTKTARVISAMFIVLAITIYLILNTVMIDKFSLLEKNYIKEHLNRVKNTFNSEYDVLGQIAYDWAVWDDTYEFIENQSEDYAIANLNENCFINLKLNAMVFIDKEGKYVYKGALNSDKQEMVPISQGLIDYINKSKILNNADPNYSVKGIIMLPEGPMVIASHPILPSDEIGEIRGNLIMAYYLNDKIINGIGDKLNLTMKMDRIDKSNKEKHDLYNSLDADGELVKPFTNDKILGYTMLKDIEGNAIVELSIEKNRDIMVIGKNVKTLILVLLILISFVTTLIILLLLNKNIIVRFIDISKEIKKIGEEKNFSKRLKTQTANDEITTVTEEINIMIDELEESQQQIIENEKNLKITNENLEKKVQERTIDLSKANISLKAEVLERKKIEEKIKHIAYHDHLTGLPNRLLFTDQLNHAVHIAKRTEKVFSIMFLDIDGFKMINDTMGHHAGDQMLIMASERLVKTLRNTDIVARVGGDEFIILIENIENINDVKTIADKIVKSFKEPFIIEGQDCFVSTSIGIAMYPTDGENGEILIKNADIAMYKAKETGKNKYVLCTPLMKEAINETLKISNKLYRALEKNELELYYQPQVSTYTYEIVGVEALLRWKNPELGMIPPSKFIVIAEQTGLIINIGEWVLKTACKQNKMWQDAGYPKIRMAINISVKQFEDHSLLTVIEDVLKETEIDPKYIEIEITESVIMKEKEYVIATLNKLSEMGIQIAIDDFGTDYSSLSYLKNLPANRIKIAMPFVHGINVNNKDESITKAIIVLAKNMNMGLIAEGVETQMQLEFLSQGLCDEIQGFYFYKPMPASEMENILKKSLAGDSLKELFLEHFENSDKINPAEI
jgi:diguanylate cyclase (GGDEF)-like protein